MASASSLAFGPLRSLGMWTLARVALGSRIQRAIHSELRRAPMPSKEGASRLSSGTEENGSLTPALSPAGGEGEPEDVASALWQLMQRYSRKSSRPSRRARLLFSTRVVRWVRTANGIGVVCGGFSVHQRRTNASPLSGLV